MIPTLNTVCFAFRRAQDTQNHPPSRQFSRTSNAHGPVELSPANDASHTASRKRDPWTPEEIQVVRDSHAKGMVINLIADPVPRRSDHSIQRMINQLQYRPDCSPKKATQWTSTEKNRLRELHDQEAPLREVFAHFPDRSYDAVRNSWRLYGKFPLHTATKNCAVWTRDEDQYIADQVSYGTSTSTIAQVLGRTRRAVLWRALKIGVTTVRKDLDFARHEDQVLIEMYAAGASISQVARKLSRTETGVRHRWLHLRPSNSEDLRRSRCGTSPESSHPIGSLRHKGLTWAAVFALGSYGYSSPRSLAQGYARAVQKHSQKLGKES